MFKKILAYALTVCLLLSLTVPAYAVDDVYSVSDDTAALSAPIYYTADYYPGVVAEMRSSGLFANNIAHGSYSEMNYNPSWYYLKGSSITSGDFNAIIPEVLADQFDVSAVYSIPNTSFTNGNSLTFNLPSTSDGYFDFQSSNFLFDQQSVQANTFYVNGTLTFNLRNLWSFTGYDADVNAKSVSWYLASDPLAVQLVIDGKAYGDIIDVTGYTSPFTALYNGGIPINASVTFDNLKVYYQGDTPDMIGFRVYTGSKFAKGSYNYGSFTAVGVTNTVTFRVSEIPDITFVQEGGDGYAGDLSGISGLLSSIQSVLTNGFNSVSGLLQVASGKDVLSALGGVVTSLEPLSASDILRVGLIALYRQISQSELKNVLSAAGTSVPVEQMSLIDLTRVGFLGLRSLMVSGSGTSFLSLLNEKMGSMVASVYQGSGLKYLHSSGNSMTVGEGQEVGVAFLLRHGLLALDSSLDAAQSYVADTVFPWQSYNMETHQLNSATNITGQNNLFFTAFQSMEDKLGRLAYVFGSDEDLALKAESEPATDAIRENFGSGPSLSDIADVAEVTTVLPNMFDTKIGVSDGFEFISDEKDSILSWFSYDTLYALDSTSRNRSSVSADVNFDTYNSNMDKVNKYRNWGDTND